jgi:nucleoside-diphosphate-sugar epimerase
MTSTVLILGAAGRIGQVLASAFADAGFEVRAQSRKPLPPALTAHPRVRAVRCDALDSAAIRTAAQGVDVVVNALNPPYTEWARQVPPLVDAAIAAAQVNGAMLLLPGNVYNFGSALPPLLTPQTPEVGDHPKARLRIAAEARMAAAPGLDSVVIRAGDFFGGPGRGSWFDLVLTSRLKSGRFIYPGAMDLAHPWAYLPDLAQTFVRVAMQRTQLHGHHRLHFAGHTLSGHEMQQVLQTLAGRTLRPGSLPWGVMRLASPFVPMWREILAMRYLWQRPHRLDDSALRALIGDVPRTPLPQALAGALAELGLLPSGAPLARA